MELYAIKVDGILVGNTEEDREKMAGAGLDTLFKCTTKKKRNAANHARFFVFLQHAFDMQDCFDDFDIFRHWVTMGAGYFRSAVTPKGVTIFIPDSISFENIEEEEFKILFRKGSHYHAPATL